MKQLAVIVLLALASCSDRQTLTIISETVDGVQVLRRVGSGSGELFVLDGIERRGAFRLRGRCLTLSVEGTEYTPVFAGPEAEPSALADASDWSPDKPPRQWSIAGAPMARELQEQQPAAVKTCGMPLFIVVSLSDPR